MPATEDDFPADFTPQAVTVRSIVKGQPASAIAARFRAHPDEAESLLIQSYNKRGSPSTFMEQEAGDFLVGWFSTSRKREQVNRFSNIADAATDYVLFSLGIGRWIEPESPGSSPSAKKRPSP